MNQFAQNCIAARCLFAKIACCPFLLMALANISQGQAVSQRKLDFTRALNVAKVSAPLSTEERDLAVGLAVQALKREKLFSERKMYLTEALIHRDAASERNGIFERLAVLTYYRYEGNLTVQVFINLDRRRAFGVKQLPNRSPLISSEELKQAQELALNHPQLRDELLPYRDELVIEGLTVVNESRSDPLAQHRVVHLLFRTGPRYVVRQWIVFVDLTTEKVIIKPAPARMKM